MELLRLYSLISVKGFLAKQVISRIIVKKFVAANVHQIMQPICANDVNLHIFKLCLFMISSRPEGGTDEKKNCE